MKKNKNEQVWVDNITGLQMNKDNATKIANLVNGEVIRGSGHDPVVGMPTPRGEMIIRPGDWVGTDQTGRWHLVRCTERNEAPKPAAKKSNR